MSTHVNGNREWEHPRKSGSGISEKGRMVPRQPKSF